MLWKKEKKKVTLEDWIEKKNRGEKEPEICSSQLGFLICVFTGRWPGVAAVNTVPRLTLELVQSATQTGESKTDASFWIVVRSSTQRTVKATYKAETAGLTGAEAECTGRK